MYNCEWHKDGTAPQKNEYDAIFVFGSNLAGNHCGGAALKAKNDFGAIPTMNIGVVGRNCYAIATLDCEMIKLPLELIFPQVFILKIYAQYNKGYHFFITRIGCGIAGFNDEQIAPMFKGFEKLQNVSLTENWKPYLID